MSVTGLSYADPLAVIWLERKRRGNELVLVPDRRQCHSGDPDLSIGPLLQMEKRNGRN